MSFYALLGSLLDGQLLLLKTPRRYIMVAYIVIINSRRRGTNSTDWRHGTATLMSFFVAGDLPTSGGTPASVSCRDDEVQWAVNQPCATVA